MLGRVSQEARVDVYHLPSAAAGARRRRQARTSRTRVSALARFAGTEYSGSGFRFRAIGGCYRVVVRGAGVYLFAGGHGTVTLHGSSVYPGSRRDVLGRTAGLPLAAGRRPLSGRSARG